MIISKKSIIKRFTYSNRIRFENVMYDLVMILFLLITIAIPIFGVIFLLYHFLPIIFEIRKYIYEISLEENQLYIRYLYFNTSKEVYIDIKKCKFFNESSERGLFLSESFHIGEKTNKTYSKKVITQYKICDWAKQENIDALKRMLENKQ